MKNQGKLLIMLLGLLMFGGATYTNSAVNVSAAETWISYADYEKKINVRYNSVLLKGSGRVKVVASKLNVRTAPNTSSAIVATYSYGEYVNLDATWSDSYSIWGSYIGASGQRRYIAILAGGMGAHGIGLSSETELAQGVFKASGPYSPY